MSNAACIPTPMKRILGPHLEPHLDVRSYSLFPSCRMNRMASPVSEYLKDGGDSVVAFIPQADRKSQPRVLWR